MLINESYLISPSFVLIHGTGEFMHASSHKRGKQRRLKKQPATDTNSEAVQRKSTEEKELDRREQLKKEVRVNPLLTTSISLVLVTRAVSIKSVEQEEEEVG